MGQVCIIQIKTLEIKDNFADNSAEQLEGVGISWHVTIDRENLT